MQKYTQTLFCAALAMTIASCSSSDSGSSGTNTTTAPVSVLVKNQSGDVVADAQVSTATSSATTNAQGIATLQLQDLQSVTATVSKSGFMSQQVSVSATASQTPVYEATIAAKQQAASAVDYSTASDANPVTVTGTSGSSVAITDNNAWTVTNENGESEPYTGSVDVFITPIDTTDTDLLEAFPGEFEGVTAAEGETLPIISFGMADFSFQTPDGAALNLAEGVSATIDIPLFQQGANADLDALTLGEEVPLWYYDYDSAQWIEEGTGIVTDVTSNGVTNRVVRGTVTHFTPWNIDKARRFGINVTINVRCEAAVPYNPDSGQIRMTLQSGGFAYTGNLGSSSSFTRSAVPFGPYCAKGYGVICDGELATVNQCFTVPFNNSVFQTTLDAITQSP